MTPSERRLPASDHWSVGTLASADDPQDLVTSYQLPAGVGKTLFDTILDLARVLCRADAYAIWERDGATGDWRSIADAGLSEGYSRSISGAVDTLSAEVMHFEEVTRAPLLRQRVEQYAAEGIRSLLTIPLDLHGAHAVVLTCYYRQPRAFDPQEAEAAARLADLAARAVTADRLRALAEQAERRAAFLAEASKLLASSLDYETTLQHVAQLAVPELADWCAVELLDDAGIPRPVALAHVNPARVEWARTVYGKLPYDPQAPIGRARVLRTGESELYPEFSAELLAAHIQDPERLAIIRELAATSLLIVPIQSRERVLGTLTLISEEAGVRFDEKVLALAEELARRAGVAIEYALLLQEQQAARKAAEQSEARLRRLVEATIIGVQIGRANGEVIFANEAFLRIAGYTQDDLAAGRINWRTLLPDFPEEERAEEERAPGSPEAMPPYETELLRRDGQRVAVLIGRARLEDSSGDVVAFVLDLSERRQLEIAATRLAAVVASSQDAIVSKDLDGIVTSWNAGAERIFGYTEEEIIGQPLAILVPPDRPNEEPEILRRLRRGERVEHFETERIRKDGQRINVSVSISPVRDSQGRIVGASKIARDITAQIALRRELQEQVDALALADRRKDEFLAMLAHELRNPLSPLTMAARIIQKVGADSPILIRQQAVIERQVRHMARLLDDLLDVSRITRGKVKLRREPLDLRHLVNAAAESCRNTIDARQHSLVLLLPEDPVPLVADAVRLEQVVCNLLLNAAKYTEPGGRIVVHVQPGPGFVEVSVRDSGVGISAEFLPQVFDLFTQAEPGIDRSQGGLGIGLTLVRSLVQLHDGSVTARSAGPGKGSEFVIRLPYTTSPAGPTPDGDPRSERRRPVN